MIPNLDEIEIERIHQSGSDRKAKKRSLLVDMNPMVDLAFLLLTFFMLATTFSKPQAMELLIPAKSTEQDLEKEMPIKESKTLSLVLFEDRVYWYRGITEPEKFEITYEEVQGLLENTDKEVDGLLVFIKPMEESNYGNMIAVLDALNEAKVQRYALGPLSEFDKTIADN